jgi:hypothetical protein
MWTRSSCAKVPELSVLVRRPDSSFARYSLITDKSTRSINSVAVLLSEHLGVGVRVFEAKAEF